MTDRDLLALAAKAVGGLLYVADLDAWIECDEATGARGSWWNPLTDDGDALRLARSLHIDIEWQATGPFPELDVEAYRRDDDAESIFCASEHEDNYRRAIVSAAAASGEAMQ